MKTNFFSITFLYLIVSLASFAQPYRSAFGKDTTQWNVICEILDWEPTFIYKAYGDTIIENKNYKFINKGFWNWFGDKYGYMREDITTGKLWFRPLIDNNERLIMDLTLNKNDSFVFESGQKYSVDTIFYRGGRKYLSFNGNSRDSLQFIEGIGPSCFLSAEFAYIPERVKIRCKFEDNMLIYHNSEYINCFDTISGTGINEKRINKFIVYPNPAANYLTVQSDLKYPYKIEFYNNLGLKTLEYILNDKSPIYLDNIPSGIYFLKISTKTEFFLSKFLKL